jgi:hypothetical protein
MSAPIGFAMDFESFRATLAAAAPPPSLGPALEALWFEAKGDWERAHTLAQADEGGAGDWVHAYLHRKEGDASNAAYWYRRAGKPASRAAFADEWTQIVTALLAQGR